jgi:hypothetical protein
MSSSDEWPTKRVNTVIVHSTTADNARITLVNRYENCGSGDDGNGDVS